MRKLAKLLMMLSVAVGGAALADNAPPPAKSLSSGEMTTRAAGIQSKIKDDYDRALRIKEQARRQKDVIKLSCVNDKLVQMKAQINIADSTNDQLGDALAKNSDDRLDLFNRLAQTGDAIHGLREEAAACIGEPELYKQEASTSFTHPDFPDNPLSPPEAGEFPVVEPPGYASPYR